MKTQREAVINFLESMDIEMLAAILDPETKYQGFEKHIFLGKLSLVFEAFRVLGDTFLTKTDGQCTDCFKCEKGFSFSGNISNSFINLMIVSSKGRVTDIFECCDFQIHEGSFINRLQQYIDDKPF